MKQLGSDKLINKQLNISINTEEFECRLVKHGKVFTSLYLEGEIMTRISPKTTSAMRIDFFLPFEKPIELNDPDLDAKIEEMVSELSGEIGCVGTLVKGTSTFRFEDV